MDGRSPCRSSAEAAGVSSPPAPAASSAAVAASPPPPEEDQVATAAVVVAASNASASAPRQPQTPAFDSQRYHQISLALEAAGGSDDDCIGTSSSEDDSAREEEAQEAKRRRPPRSPIRRVRTPSDVLNMEEGLPDTDDDELPAYGELSVLGVEHGHPAGLPDSFVLHQRERPNGLQPRCDSPLVSNAADTDMPYTLSVQIKADAKSKVLFGFDADRDMYQIGRSSSHKIDFRISDVFPDMVCPNKEAYKERIDAHCSISRFACRIQVDRKRPHVARIYAAGFDDNNRIFIGDNAPRWDNTPFADGLTTNGIHIAQPTTGDGKRTWHEVSVLGKMYERRQYLDNEEWGSRARYVDNVLRDGTLIDAYGSLMVYHTRRGMKMRPSQRKLAALRCAVRLCGPVCPIGLHRLEIDTSRVTADDVHFAEVTSGWNNQESSDDQAVADRNGYVYNSCGHVVGATRWGSAGGGLWDHTCPVCKEHGKTTRLIMCHRMPVIDDCDLPLCMLLPCGHTTSYRTATTWSNLHVIRRNHTGPICPFCNKWLNRSKPFVRLIFQTLS